MNFVAILLQYLPFLVQGAGEVQQIWDYVQKVREAAKQSGEWTPEAEAAFDAEIEKLKTDPPDWWKTDEQLGQPGQ